MNTDNNYKVNLTLAICMYNAERYIEETLQSVLNQTMQEFHLIIVNDCSTDSSVSIVRKFFEQHPRQYELIDFDENHGLAYARHFAEHYAKTTYMMFLDSDVLLYHNAIKQMYDKITSDGDLMAVGCYVEYIDRLGRRIGGGIFLGEKSKEKFYIKAKNKKLIFMLTSAIYDRQLALSIGGHAIDGFPEGKPRFQDFCEDLDLWTRMSDFYVDGKAIVVVPEILYKYRKSGGLSSNSFNMIIKMRYTKTNLLRRRAGEKEFTFIEFRNQISAEDLKRIEKDAKAADCLRNGVFYLKEHSFIKGGWTILKSVWYKPTYIIDKFKHNILRIK